ncbi:MAG: transposase [Thermoleophilaceae bacterium]
MPPATAIRAHRFRLEPTAAQAQFLERAGGARRFVYNWGLAAWREYYSAEGTSPPRGYLSAELTRLKRDGTLAWLYDLPAQLPQQALLDLERAFKAFLRGRGGYPRFRRKKGPKMSFRLPQHVRIDNHWVYVPKLGWIRARVSRDPGIDLGAATVSRGCDGRWFVSINERFVLPSSRGSCDEDVVGVDAGLIDLLVCSDGRRVSAPRFARTAENQVRREQRRYARTQPGSRRRERARRRLARRHGRVADRRQDFLHKITTKITTEHDVVVLEDLSLHALAKTKLGKSFGDAALGELQRQLRYRALWTGQRTVTVDRFFPSTKRCSSCSLVAPTLGLGQRSWRCEHCHAVHDRDLNAALNLRREGLRLLHDRGAHGHDESPRSPGQTPTGAPDVETGTAPDGGCQTGSILV